MSSFISPKRAIIETPYKCNLKCQNCQVWKEDYRKLRGEEKDLLREVEVFSLHNQLVEAGIKRISYIGGEPFLEKNIFSRAENAISLGLYVSAVTNGSVLETSELEKISERGLFYALVFSIDGPQNIHDFIRGRKGAFAAAMHSLKTLQKIKSREKARFPKIYIYCTVSSLNYKYLEQVHRIALSVNANLLRFQLASCLSREILDDTNRALGFEAVKTHSYINSNRLGPEEINLAAKSLRRIRSLRFSMKIEAEPALEGLKNKSCRFIGKDMVITPSGKVLLCPMLNAWHAGDIRKNKIKEILEKLADMAKKIKDMAESGKLPVCRECCVEKII
ncbi:MAG: hypothetical protein Fur0012_10980 [Elusimicrobiota bacterium]